LIRNLGLESHQVYDVEGPLGQASLLELARLDRLDLLFAPFQPRTPQELSGGNIFEAIRRHDILLYHPYDSFTPVIDFIRAAAADPDVMGIKQTLYRVGSNSPIVEALTEARENGKQVAVMLELRARFDEENNIAWARALEDEGVHVVYGVPGLKTHAKMCMVVRREADGIRRYVHLGTGNYNPVTGRLYSDISYFTCDPDISADVADLFNALTGYANKLTYRRLLVAPSNLREEVLGRIEREIEHRQRQGGGYIAFKMNALVDKECIKALYRASQAGVKIDLQVRGICCLRPGLQGVSDNILVTSIVGRFLEHSRIFCFGNGHGLPSPQATIHIGSADMMPRNLDRRVEALVPILNPTVHEQILSQIMVANFADNQQSWAVLSDGSSERIMRKKGESPFNLHQYFMTNPSLSGRGKSLKTDSPKPLRKRTKRS
jgi:polyphosphate kinase